MRRALLGMLCALLTATPVLAKPAVWVVRDRDSEMVLFGSVHVLPRGLDWRPPALDAALAKADDVWFEAPVGREADEETARLVARVGLLPPGQSLFRMLPEADAAALLRMAELYGVDKLMLDRFEPWLAEVALSDAALGKLADAFAEQGVEEVLGAAVPPTAQRRAFATSVQQLALFDETPLDQQILSLRTTLRDLQSHPGGFRSLVEAWMSADLARLEREALEPLRRTSPKLFQRIVSTRNAQWTRTLDARLKQSGRTVVIVGAGHLVGPGGLPARLRALGYSVEGP